MRFRPEQHVRRQRDFQNAREKGRRIDCGAFTLWYYRRAPDASLEGSSATDGVRVGVIASTAAVGSAVERNFAKRRLREVFRAQQKLVPAGFDLLLIARSSLNRLDYRAIEQKFVDACRRIFPANAQS